VNEVRFGILGLGNIGRYHKVPRARLTAVCTSRPGQVPLPETVNIFGDASALMQSGLVDAVLIATPHRSHEELGQRAFATGLHVVVEKPIASHKAEAERLVRAHGQMPALKFGAMFQFRVEPRYQKLRDLIQGGALGRITRMNWINTDWFRPEAYYQGSAWRATWRGEGGGALINQCLHNLDMLQWLLGQPARLRAFCQFGRHHDIEVEDDVTAYLEWPGGATGTFVSSTGEAPGTNRLEVAGTRGKVVLEQGRLIFTQNECDAAEFCRTAPTAFVNPAAQELVIPFTDAALPHAMLLENFVAGILDGTPLLAPGGEGIHSLELANAMVFSSLRGETVELPLDGAAWAAKLNELIANSQRQERTVRVVSGDVAGSFRR
jgi:predicted dehydrogenase